MKRLIKPKIAVLLIVVVLACVFIKDKPHAYAKDVKKPNSVATTTNASSPSSSVLISDINNAINDSSTNPDGLSVAVSVVNLDTGKSYNAGATGTLYKAASTAKVLAAVDYLHEVEMGQASLNQNIDGTSAQQLIQQMIEVSDDNAWTGLNNFLGDQQQTYASSIGLSSFTGGEYNTMTASDMAKLLYELYQGQLINNTDRNLLYNYMENTTSTNLIQAALPANATVYHKYGQLWGYLNDASIVQDGNLKFVLVIYTNNPDGTSDEYNDQVALIHTITQTVFNDLSNKAN